MSTRIRLEVIEDGGAQMRVAMSDSTIADYAEAMAGGATFPAIDVYHDGECYWLADGYHRLGAAKALEHDEIEVVLHEGTQRDAIMHGIGANARHGLQRTQADKRKAVERLLTDAEWSKLSDRKIAAMAKVNHKTVAKVRREMNGDFPTLAGGPKAPNGEIPTVPTKTQNGEFPTLMTDFLRACGDDDLLAECRRRGLVDA